MRVISHFRIILLLFVLQKCQLLIPLLFYRYIRLNVIVGTHFRLKRSLWYQAMQFIDWSLANKLTQRLGHFWNSRPFYLLGKHLQHSLVDRHVQSFWWRKHWRHWTLAILYLHEVLINVEGLLGSFVPNAVPKLFVFNKSLYFLFFEVLAVFWLVYLISNDIYVDNRVTIFHCLRYL